MTGVISKVFEGYGCKLLEGLGMVPQGMSLAPPPGMKKHGPPSCCPPPSGLAQGPIKWTTAGQLWLQIRATGSAAHPPSTQSDGNGKPACIHLLPASFVCAVKTIFLLRTSDKKCKKMDPGIEPICGVSVMWPIRSANLLGPLGF